MKSNARSSRPGPRFCSPAAAELERARRGRSPRPNRAARHVIGERQTSRSSRARRGRGARSRASGRRRPSRGEAATTHGQLDKGVISFQGQPTRFEHEVRTSPMQVAGLGGIAAVTGGWVHSFALGLDGRYWGWGADQNGQLGDGIANFRDSGSDDRSRTRPEPPRRGRGAHARLLAGRRAAIPRWSPATVRR